MESPQLPMGQLNRNAAIDRQGLLLGAIQYPHLNLKTILSDKQQKGAPRYADLDQEAVEDIKNEACLYYDALRAMGGRPSRTIHSEPMYLHNDLLVGDDYRTAFNVETGRRFRGFMEKSLKNHWYKERLTFCMEFEQWQEFLVARQQNTYLENEDPVLLQSSLAYSQNNIAKLHKSSLANSLQQKYSCEYVTNMAVLKNWRAFHGFQKRKFKESPYWERKVPKMIDSLCQELGYNEKLLWYGVLEKFERARRGSRRTREEAGKIMTEAISGLSSSDLHQVEQQQIKDAQGLRETMEGFDRVSYVEAYYSSERDLLQRLIKRERFIAEICDEASAWNANCTHVHNIIQEDIPCKHISDEWTCDGCEKQYRGLCLTRFVSLNSEALGRSQSLYDCWQDYTTFWKTAKQEGIYENNRIRGDSPIANLLNFGHESMEDAHSEVLLSQRRLKNAKNALAAFQQKEMQTRNCGRESSVDNPKNGAAGLAQSLHPRKRKRSTRGTTGYYQSKRRKLDTAGHGILISGHVILPGPENEGLDDGRSKPADIVKYLQSTATYWQTVNKRAEAVKRRSKRTKITRSSTVPANFGSLKALDDCQRAIEFEWPEAMDMNDAVPIASKLAKADNAVSPQCTPAATTPVQAPQSTSPRVPTPWEVDVTGLSDKGELKIGLIPTYTNETSHTRRLEQFAKSDMSERTHTGAEKTCFHRETIAEPEALRHTDHPPAVSSTPLAASGANCCGVDETASSMTKTSAPEVLPDASQGQNANPTSPVVLSLKARDQSGSSKKVSKTRKAGKRDKRRKASSPRVTEPSRSTEKSFRTDAVDTAVELSILLQLVQKKQPPGPLATVFSEKPNMEALDPGKKECSSVIKTESELLHESSHIAESHPKSDESVKRPMLSDSPASPSQTLNESNTEMPQTPSGKPNSRLPPPGHQENTQQLDLLSSTQATQLFEAADSKSGLSEAKLGPQPCHSQTQVSEVGKQPNIPIETPRKRKLASPDADSETSAKRPKPSPGQSTNMSSIAAPPYEPNRADVMDVEHDPISSETTTTSPQPPQATDIVFPNGADIRVRVPKGGVKLRSLLAMLNASTAGKEETNSIVNLVKENARYDRGKRVVFPL